MNAEIYQPPFGDDVNAQLDEARERVNETNQFLSLMGACRFDEFAPGDQLRNALDLICSGIASGDWKIVAEAAALLQDLEAQERTD